MVLDWEAKWDTSKTWRGSRKMAVFKLEYQSEIFDDKMERNSGACTYVASKFQESILQWLFNEQKRWIGAISQSGDVVGSLMFKAYLNQIDISGGQPLKGKLRKHWRAAT